MGDVNGKCKACKETKDAMGNVMVWDPPKIIKTADPDTKEGHTKASIDSNGTLIDLDLGNMIIETRKLKKSSSFNIESPVGVGGIRG